MNTTQQSVRFYDEAPEIADFREEVLRGLAGVPKRISPKFFYDRRGSELFDEICQLPEYYLTRVEVGILRASAREIAALTGGDAVLMELGSGSSRKVRLLLEALRPAAYLAVDISRDFLLQTSRRLAYDYPWLEVHAACADLCKPFSVSGLPASGRRLAFYPGSSIGNFEPREARTLLRGWLPLLGADGALLIGVDLKKEPAILHAAYNDAAGVTAAFNLNLLSRLRRELGADVKTSAFVHRAFYNEALGRIEMHLASRKTQGLWVDGACFNFVRDETIHTENSYKYTVAEFYALVHSAGYAVERTWTDRDAMFSVHYLRVAT